MAIGALTALNFVWLDVDITRAITAGPAITVLGAITGRSLLTLTTGFEGGSWGAAGHLSIRLSSGVFCVGTHAQNEKIFFQDAKTFLKCLRFSVVFSTDCGVAHSHGGISKRIFINSYKQ